MAAVVGIGLSCIDLLITLPEYPREDTKMPAEALLQQGGGPVATALVALSKLGERVSYLGSIADDLFSEMMLKEFNAYGVDTGELRVKPNTTSTLAVVLINKSRGTRTIVWKRGTLPSASPEDISPDLIKKAKVLHLDGHHVDAALVGAKIAKESGCMVCLDAGNLFPRIEELVAVTDILVTSEEFALAFSGEKDPQTAGERLFNTYRPELVTITQGDRGGIYFDGKEWGEYPSFPVQVEDSTGAGDVFHGAFIYGYLKEWSLKKITRLASAVSALKCTCRGGRVGIPSLSEVNTFLARHQHIK